MRKTPPDYDKALAYMETLFKTVAPDRILWKDYHYMARILVKKNQNYPKMVDDLTAAATASLKRKKQACNCSHSLLIKQNTKPVVDDLNS